MAVHRLHCLLFHHCFCIWGTASCAPQRAVCQACTMALIPEHVHPTVLCRSRWRRRCCRWWWWWWWCCVQAWTLRGWRQCTSPFFGCPSATSLPHLSFVLGRCNFPRATGFLHGSSPTCKCFSPCQAVHDFNMLGSIHVHLSLPRTRCWVQNTSPYAQGCGLS